MLTKTALCGWVWIKSAQFSKVLVSLVLQTFSFSFPRQIFLRWQIIIFHELKGRTMFFHWKGEVRLSPPPSYVIRPGKSWENFNSKFSANLDFKEFELQSLNWQLVYIPCKIKGARKKYSLIWISRGSFSCHVICHLRVTENGYDSITKKQLKQFLGVIFFFDRMFLSLGNVMFLGGLLLLVTALE